MGLGADQKLSQILAHITENRLIFHLVPKISAIENTAGNTFSMGHVNFTDS